MNGYLYGQPARNRVKVTSELLEGVRGRAYQCQDRLDKDISNLCCKFFLLFLLTFPKSLRVSLCSDS